MRGFTNSGSQRINPKRRVRSATSSISSNQEIINKQTKTQAIPAGKDKKKPVLAKEKNHSMSFGDSDDQQHSLSGGDSDHEQLLAGEESVRVLQKKKKPGPIDARTSNKNSQRKRY